MRYLKSLGFLLAFFSANTIIAQVKPKPNVLWITIEDTSPQFIGAYGNPDARTPNIDKLAKNGIRFTNAFSTGTVCSPSRSCIITGVKTYELGAGHHRSSVPIPDYIKGFPYYLKQAGYYTSNNQKTDYNIANGKNFIKEAWDESSGKAGWWNRKPGQPFFSVFNLMESHQSRTMTWSYAQYKKEIFDGLKPEERIGDNAFKMPPIYHDSPEMRKQFARVYNSLKFTDNEIGDIIAKLEKDHLRDSTIIFFYAGHGEGMPRGKTNGINYGYRIPFVIWFPPMYSYLSPWGKAGMVTDELIDFEDLAPTLISLAGGKMPDYLKGRVLIGANRDKKAKELFLSNDRADNGPDLTRTVTDGRFVYSRNFMDYQPELRYIRYMEIGDIKQEIRKDYKNNKLDSLQESLMKPREPEMLFDIETDPWELHNLANEPAYKAKLKKFRKELDKNIVKQKDILFLPEYQTSMISDSTTLYEFRKNSKNYPIKSIYKSASLSGFRGSEIAERQVKLLKSDNEMVRYWTAMGLRSQNAEVIKNLKPAVLAAVEDNYPPVAITAAAIAYDVFNDQRAESFLKESIKNKNMDLALMAVNYLLYIKNVDLFTATIKEVKGQKAISYNVKAACNDFLGKLGLVANDAEHEDID